MPTSLDQASQLQSLYDSSQSRTSSPQSASGEGAIVIGDTSAKTSMGSGGSGGGGGAGYSAGASIAEGPTTTSSGAYGDVQNRQAFGDFNVSYGSGSISAGGGKTIMWLGLAAAAAVAVFFLARRK